MTMVKVLFALRFGNLVIILSLKRVKELEKKDVYKYYK